LVLKERWLDLFPFASITASNCSIHQGGANLPAKS